MPGYDQWLEQSRASTATLASDSDTLAKRLAYYYSLQKALLTHYHTINLYHTTA